MLFGLFYLNDFMDKEGLPQSVAIIYSEVKREYFLALILLIGYALFDETHQLFTPGRTFQIIDLAIDSFSGLIIFYFKYTPLN